jgi:hypothetical protein
VRGSFAYTYNPLSENVRRLNIYLSNAPAFLRLIPNVFVAILLHEYQNCRSNKLFLNMSSQNPVYITAAGVYLPGAPISNDEVEAYLGYLFGKPSRTKQRMLK